jgi:hypothetical protein
MDGSVAVDDKEYKNPAINELLDFSLVCPARPIMKQRTTLSQFQGVNVADIICILQGIYYNLHG